jgi:hypothetical protein
MQYLKVMSLAVLMFTAVGWGIGHAASMNLVIEHPDTRIAAYMIPIGVGAGLGLFIGVIASIFTVFTGGKGPD